ncbi:MULTISPECIES: isoprenoid biosynthesis glyoxalase ElbB [Shewanella]|uniref:isoprenoid biosynthesis glyoxalase ElbB n=1 Tax=Shewanella TaxID=22 RepID=UPI001183551E|nr:MULTISPECIES: isoprenoid biosynthesis glyoxalase ElbB [Shewanella]QYJ82342.1 isoprenoid biosynthesis glyoxalase ElbB [Shewanella aegiceratis]QYJ93705.1 isoprenoid biosynthesis glyoxalase ElbB [Shewanella spartinae]TVP14438.1 isoprenoid biosynthesis protein [Shewanella sp. KCT]
MKKFAVLLSGAGVFDGSELHEAVLTLLSLTQAGVSYQCFAPNIEQMHVVNHLTGEVAVGEHRNVLVESARIARGDIKATDELDIQAFDGLVIPGGFGAAKNLCNFAVVGSECEVAPSVKAFISEFVEADKPVGFICISPVMIPKLYGEKAKGTIGHDSDTAHAFNLMGGEHVEANVEQIVVDEARKLVSTPAYMLAENIAQAHIGIDKLVKKVIELA